MSAYYNEIDPYAAQWLRNLIAAGHIAPGDVDERSIEDVNPDDLAGYAQCHFFAGIGVWSYALRRAGWSDDWPVWTGSCPCQPFSAAGQGGGFADERHLWPAWHHLIGERRPPVVFGEQVASKDGLGWLDLVSADLEGTGYACGPVDLCAAGVGAPHIRQRLWFTAERLDDDDDARRRGQIIGPESSARDQAWVRVFGEGRRPSGLAGADNAQWGPDAAGGDLGDGHDAGRAQGAGDAQGRGGSGGLADSDGGNACAERLQRGGQHRQQQEDRRTDAGVPGPVNGFWRASDWLCCRDDKWRPVEPGTFPLVDVTPARVGRLRAYGNAIVAEAAEAVIRSYLDHRTDEFA